MAVKTACWFCTGALLLAPACSPADTPRAAPSPPAPRASLAAAPNQHWPQVRGKATRIFPIGPAFKADRWYRIRFEWTYRESTGTITVGVDDRAYASDFEFVPATAGPGRFFLFGHVETTAPDGCLHFRNFRVEGRK